MKKTKLFILLIIATMLLLASCKEKPAENIKTTKDYLANKVIFTTLDSENLPGATITMAYEYWCVALVFDENSNIISTEEWEIADFTGKVNENKYEVSFKVFDVTDEGLSPFSLDYNLTIEAINSNRVKISGTVFRTHALALSLNGEASLSDRAPKWLRDYRWNMMQRYIYNGDQITLLGAYTGWGHSSAPSANINLNAKATDDTYTVDTISNPNGTFANGTTLTLKRSQSNDYELNAFSSETMIFFGADGSTTEQTIEKNYTVARFDDLPDWASEYDNLKNSDGSLHIALSEREIAATDSKMQSSTMEMAHSDTSSISI